MKFKIKPNWDARMLFMLSRRYGFLFRFIYGKDAYILSWGEWYDTPKKEWEVGQVVQDVRDKKKCASGLVEVLKISKAVSESGIPWAHYVLRPFPQNTIYQRIKAWYRRQSFLHVHGLNPERQKMRDVTIKDMWDKM